MLIIKPGILAFYSPQILADKHQHAALQLVWPGVQGHWQLNAEKGTGPLLIAPQAEHDLAAEHCWVILLEPLSVAGKHALQQINGQLSVSLPGPASAADSTELLAALSHLLGLDKQAFNLQITDSRLLRLQQQLDQCFNGGCIKPSQWRARDIAAGLALSESRFLHLFREQMHMPWRPYLLWRRLLCAVQALHQGKNATTAAQDAGFADSAHLSRTFRRHFGLSVREAVQLARN